MDTNSSEPAVRSNDIVNVARRGIAVWLWLGLLTAYISTSALFAGQLFSGLTRDYHFSGVGAVVIAYATAPSFIIVLGWATLMQFTASIFDMLVGYTQEELTANDDYLKFRLRAMRTRFRMSVVLLVFSWISALIIAAATPLFLLLGNNF